MGITYGNAGRNGIEYRRILLSRGLEVSSSRKAREQLTNYILSSRPKNVALCVDAVGWHKNYYILPNESFGTSQETIIFQNLHDSSQPTQGKLSQWQEQISKYCEKNSKLLFAVSAAFAPPILHLLAEESGGFHFLGPSSIGKTTLLQVASSVWGGPERLHRWRTTTNGLEALASMHNDSLLCLDEMGQVDEKDVGEIAYMLANGSGKGRCQKDGAIRKKNKWRLLFLSTGELGLSDHINQSGKKVKAGQEVRLIDLLADTESGLGIFDCLHHYDHAMDLAKNLSDASKQYYGTAIRQFLKNVVANIHYAVAYVNAKRNEFLSSNVPPNADGQVQRVARRFALLAGAGELATTFKITGWEEYSAFNAVACCFKDWIKLRGGLSAKEPQIALSQVRHFFELHGESRFTPWLSDVSQNKTLNRAGFRKNGEFFVFPEVFKQDICAGLNPRYVAQLCLSKGWLVADNHGKAVSTHRMPDTGNVRRVYHFCEKVFDDETHL
jgi:putative DNA primase/helicase